MPGNVTSPLFPPLPVTTKTTSSSTSRRITGTFDLEVPNYLQLKDMGLDECVTSPCFNFAGYDWQVAFYPDGEDGYASSYLRYLGQTEDVTAKYTLSVLGNEGRPRPVTSRGTPECVVFTPASRRRSQGYRKFVHKSELSRLGDGRFTLRCVLTVVRDMDMSPPQPDLPGHFERMMLGRDGMHGDVTFLVGGHKFGAHRCMLVARSPVLAAQLLGPRMAKKVVITVVDVEPAIFEMLLGYIYTDSLPMCYDDQGGYDAMVMEKMVVAASKYGLESLKLRCEEELCTRMNEGFTSSKHAQGFT